MVGLIIWLIVVIIIAVAVLGVVRAALATPAMKWLEPYSNLIYALFVLLIVLLCVSMFYGNGPWDGFPRLPR